MEVEREDGGTSLNLNDESDDQVRKNGEERIVRPVVG